MTTTTLLTIPQFLTLNSKEQIDWLYSLNAEELKEFSALMDKHWELVKHLDQ